MEGTNNVYLERLRKPLIEFSKNKMEGTNNGYLERLRKPLIEFSKNKEEVKKDFTVEWFYCGNSKDNLNLFYEWNDGVDIPKHVGNCICGHDIEHNYWIKNKYTFKILTVGSCCMKKFDIGKVVTKKCEKCFEPHKNRSNNLCNNCRKILDEESKLKCKMCDCSLNKNNKTQVCSDCKPVDRELLYETVTFGKYSGLSFKEILEKDFNYCRWIYKQENSTNWNFRAFQYYLKYYFNNTKADAIRE